MYNLNLYDQINAPSFSFNVNNLLKIKENIKNSYITTYKEIADYNRLLVNIDKSIVDNKEQKKITVNLTNNNEKDIELTMNFINKYKKITCESNSGEVLFNANRKYWSVKNIIIKSKETKTMDFSYE